MKPSVGAQMSTVHWPLGARRGRRSGIVARLPDAEDVLCVGEQADLAEDDLAEDAEVQIGTALRTVRVVLERLAPGIISSMPMRPLPCSSHIATAPAVWRGVSGTGLRPAAGSSGSVASTWT
jgi:hypothetical protein